MNRAVFGARWLLWLLVAMASCGASALAGDPKFRVELVWGTNESKPPEKDFKELDAGSRDKLGRTLRWKNYYVVNKQDAVVTAKDAKRLELSARTAVEIRMVGTQVEVRIFQLKAGTEPKLVDTKRCELAKLQAGELFTFAGNSKDNWDDAWLVIVRAAPAPGGA